MAKSGVLEPGTLFQQLGRIRKRHSSNSPRSLGSKSGRGLLLLLVAVVCSLLLASRLIFVLMYFFKRTAGEVYVEPQSGVQAVLYEASGGLRTKGDEDVVRVGWKEIGSDNEEKSDDWTGVDLLELKDKADNEDNREETRPLEEETRALEEGTTRASEEGTTRASEEGTTRELEEDTSRELEEDTSRASEEGTTRALEEDTSRALEEDTTQALEEDTRQLEEQTRPLGEDDGEKIVEVEDTWNSEKTNIEELANSEAEIGDETVIGAGEKDGTEGALVREEDEKSDDEGALRHRKMPDAMAYLEQLAGNLIKTGVQEDNGPYHSRRIFESDYAEMMRSLKIFIYPHDHNDPFHKIFEPSNQTPSGNYASEEFFQQALMSSSFVTKDASQADFFFMPVSITKARLDKRIDVGGLKDFCAKYVTRLRSQWNYWNRSNGADHFYLSCHSVARNAMDQVPAVKQNAIQLLCPASYFLASYITHKDASVPQIWPRMGPEPKEVRLIAQRKRLAFFAGALNSPVRQELQKIWASDDKIMVHKGRVPYPYSHALLTSKFCLHAKGFEVNTARLGDAMYYGCVPVVIANHYDLPYQDILDWTKFSIVISSLDIPLLKKTLEAVTDEQYAELHSQVLKARKHFQWHNPPRQYDAFHTVMYELWKRRHIVKRSSH